MTGPVEDREGMAALPPVSPGTPNGAPERDPADNWGVTYGEPLPSVADSPHWAEVSGAT